MLGLRPTGWVQDLTASKRGNNFIVEIAEPAKDSGEEVLVIALVSGRQARAVTMLVKAGADIRGDLFHKVHLMPALAQLKPADGQHLDPS